jgi:hypothetical protein
VLEVIQGKIWMSNQIYQYFIYSYSYSTKKLFFSKSQFVLSDFFLFHIFQLHYYIAFEFSKKSIPLGDQNIF